MANNSEAPDLSKKRYWYNTAAKEILGISFTDMKTSVEEMSD